MPGVWCILHFYCNSTLISPISSATLTEKYNSAECFTNIMSTAFPKTAATVSLAHPSTARNLLLVLTCPSLPMPLCSCQSPRLKTQGSHWLLLLTFLCMTINHRPSPFTGPQPESKPSCLQLLFSGRSTLFSQSLFLILWATQHTAARVIIPKGSLIIAFSCSHTVSDSSLTKVQTL